MATTTLGILSVTSAWQEVTATFAGAANVDVMIFNRGPGSLQVYDNPSAPGSDSLGSNVPVGEDIYVSSEKIYVRSPGGTTANIRTL